MTEDNPEIDMALRLLSTTGTSLFLTGKAGTGKTTFLRKLRTALPKRMVVLAPTGIAAIHAGGVTIHSFFQLPFTPFVPGSVQAKQPRFAMRGQKLKLIQSLDLIVIDEISMVRADLLDAVDDVLRRLRRNSKPFGGVQLLLIGDLQQLAPVVREEEWTLLSPYYSTLYFFGSKALQQVDYVTLELKKVYRQTDLSFLNLLYSVRQGQADPDVLQRLNSRYVPGFQPAAEEGYVRLTTHNRQADQVNEQELAKLSGKSYAFNARIKGKYPEYAYPTEATLVLKKGAQVMFVKNDAEKRFFNGMIGKVVEIDKEGFTVQPHNGQCHFIKVQPETWENVKYVLDTEANEVKETVEGTFQQYPVKLAWAITIHKSQGLTFDRVMIDASAAFAHGQTYVALSRCRTLEGIVLSAPIPPSAIIADQTVLQYTRHMTAHKVDEEALAERQRTYELRLLTELFTFSQERVAFSTLVRTMEEHFPASLAQATAIFSEQLRKFDLEVMGVASRFHAQYTRMFQNGATLQDEALHERIVKGAAYFAEKQAETRDMLLTKGKIMVGNAAVRKRFTTAIKQLQTLLDSHIHLLRTTAEKGFCAQAYLNERAKEDKR